MPDTPEGLRPAAPVARALAELLRVVPALRATGPVETTSVTGCTHDSRAVRPGDLYAALPGARAHGADFAAQAVAAGAVAVLTDPAGAARLTSYDGVLLVAEDPRAVLGQVSSWAYGDPSHGLLVLAVTGTNGKTTTAFLLEAGLRAAGHTTGLIGTVLTRIGDETVPSVRTTPEAPDLHALFAVMLERGVTAVAMEVSSHALVLGRVDGVRFLVSVFTNLSQDHLDFHGSMEAYEAAKASLFTPERTVRAVVCADDEAGQRLLDRALVPTWSYGSDGADYAATDVDLLPDGSSFDVVVDGGEVVEGSTWLPGWFNVLNAVGAIAALDVAHQPLDRVVRGITAMRGVPGRVERVEAGQDFAAVVDYAHTPDAVTALLAALRPLTAGRLIVVLGCGGDRDRGKRPLMGRAAVEGADLAVLTSDNPRSEDPLAVLAEMAAPGAVVEPDRRAAIELAVREARPGDTVVVAGKGHESGQEVGGVVTPFDDREVLREALQAVLA